MELEVGFYRKEIELRETCPIFVLLRVLVSKCNHIETIWLVGPYLIKVILRESINELFKLNEIK